jgi:hypothetical protein
VHTSFAWLHGEAHGQHANDFVLPEGDFYAAIWLSLSVRGPRQLV